MKKVNFLKTVLGVALAILISATAFGQVYNSPDYEEFNPDETNGPTHQDSIDYVSVNSTLRYYAVPDPVYHPNYQSAGTLTANFKWLWTMPGGFPTTDTVTSGNYIEVTYANTGSHSINVAERAPSSMGGCTGSLSYLYVNVIPLPTSTFSIVPADLNPAVASWSQITASAAYQICGAQAAQTLTLTFAESVPIHYASYSFQVTEEIDLIDVNGNVIAAGDGAETVIDNFPLGAGTQLSYLNEGALTNANFAQTSPGNFEYTFSSDALAIVSNAGTNYRTRYTYRVRTADNANPFTDVSATNTFVSNILAKSDYLAAVGAKRSVGFTNNAVYFIVNPAPVTGPIYHIPNNFSF